MSQQGKSSKRSKGLTALIGGSGLIAGALLLAAPAPASAALVYDLRLTDGSKQLSATPGSTFTVDVFATITGANGVATDDGFANGFYSLVSNNATTGSTVGLSITGGGPIAPFASGAFQNGLIQDIDTDGDADVGKKSGNSGNGNFVFSRASDAVFGTAPGPASFKIASFTVLVGAGFGSDNATLNVALPNTDGTGPVVISSPVNYRQDGGTVLNLANVSVGDAIVVSVPEPAALGVLGLGVIGLARRRNR
jgi:hypothetical protein